MSNNGKYIKLPCLRSISVENYTLFKGKLSYKVKDRLNLFLGINGIGKTTTANVILFGLVGKYEDINGNYFKSRIDKPIKPDPKVSLEVMFGTIKVCLTRNLFSSSIIDLSIDNEKYKNENDDINDYYERFIQEITGVTIDDLSFLLRYFLIREEEGNFLLWDQDAQSRVIRLLLNYPGFDSKFKEKSSIVREYDSKERDRQWFLKQLNDVLREIESGDYQREELSALREEFKKNEENVKTLRLEEEDLVSKLSYIRKIKSDKEAEQDNMEAELEYLHDRVNAFEEELFGFIYTSPKVNLASDKLKRFNICMFCDSKIDTDDSKRILEIIERNKHCPVCDSGLRRANQKDTINDEGVVKELNALRNSIEELDKRRAPLSNELKSVSEEIASLVQKHQSLNIGISKSLSILEDLKIKISSQTGRAYALKDIPSISNKINDMEVQYAEAKKNRIKHSKELERLNNKLNEQIHSFERKLNEIFDKYVRKYFSEECELIPAEGKQSQEYRINFTTFVPKLRGSIRRTTRTLSTSERIFLESVFRLSLVELYCFYASIKPFILIETSDGSLDVFSVDNYANALNKFSKNKFPFISISNLNETAFLPKLISGYEDIDDRTLRFLNFGKLPKEKFGNRQRFIDIQKKILNQ